MIRKGPRCTLVVVLVGVLGVPAMVVVLVMVVVICASTRLSMVGEHLGDAGEVHKSEVDNVRGKYFESDRLGDDACGARMMASAFDR